jgi:hypothetical protein
MTVDTASLMQRAQTAFARGAAEEGRAHLQQAAAQKNAEAVFAYAVALAYGQGGPTDRRGAVAQLASVKDISAAARRFWRVAIASGWGDQGGWQLAFDDLIAGAQAGQSSDLREAGLLYLIAGEAPTALSLLLAAADAGDPGGAMALMRLGYADPAIHQWATAVAEGLQRSRHPLSADLTALPQQSPEDLAPPDWDLIADLTVPDAMALPQAEELIETLAARTFAEAIPRAVCDHLLTSGLRALQPSSVVDPQTGEKALDPHRQSLSMTFAPHLQDLVHVAVERRMAAMAGLPADHTERLNLLFYRQGEQYKPHVDYFAPDDPGNAIELEKSGQRVATSLVCLHTAEGGGATRFPRYNAAWTGNIGDGFSFRNVKPSGEVEPMSLHQGEPVTSGWKALASLWIRERPFIA